MSAYKYILRVESKNRTHYYMKVVVLAVISPFLLDALPTGMTGSNGIASYYTEWNRNPGSCGHIPSITNIVALSPNNMPHSCGRCIIVYYGGKSHKAVVTDTCPSCGPKKIDLSNALFSQMESLDKGLINVDWDFCDC